jgi:copper(I)-binding protein
MTSSLLRARRGPAAAAVAALLFAITGCASGAAEEPPAPTEEPAVAVSDAWVRATTDTEDPSMSAAFMTLKNNAEEPVTLTGASSPVAERAELHEMTMVDGDSVMQKVRGGIQIDPGAGQLLMPGGRHVMLMGLDGELAAGDEVELTLEFSDGSTQELTVPVKEFTEEEGHYHEPGTEEHDHGDADPAEHDHSEHDHSESPSGSSTP